MMIKHFAAALAAGACLVSANTAFAAVASASLNVSANITASCTVETRGALDFGELIPNAENTAQSDLVVKCNNEPPVIVRLFGSSGGVDHFGMRNEYNNEIFYGARVNGSRVDPGEDVAIPLSRSGPAGGYTTTAVLQAFVFGVDVLLAPAGAYRDQLEVHVVY